MAKFSEDTLSNWTNSPRIVKRQNFLMRKGACYIILYEQNFKIFIPAWHPLTELLARGKLYIKYHSADQTHNLIFYPYLEMQIFVNGFIESSRKTYNILVPNIANIRDK